MMLAKAITAIRNANTIGSPTVSVRGGKLTRAVCDCLLRNGYVWSVEENGQDIQLHLKYAADGKPLLRSLCLVSRPSRRVCVTRGEVVPVMSGIGCQLLTTDRGVITDAESRKLGIGGEILATIG